MNVLDGLREIILSACAQYDKARGQEDHLTNHVKQYFKWMDETDADRARLARMKVDPAYRKAEERKDQEKYRLRAKQAAEEEKKYERRVKQRERRKDLVRLGYAVEAGLYVSVKIAGRAVGGIWYSELAALRGESVFEASLADQILGHATPDGAVRVRDIVSETTLAGMVEKARQVADQAGRLPELVAFSRRPKDNQAVRAA